MPLYDYDCETCGTRFEVIHGLHDDGPSLCPACGGHRVRKAFAPPAIHFKGSGWAKKERRSAVKAGTGASSDGSGEAKGGEAARPDGASTTAATSGDGGATADATASKGSTAPASTGTTSPD